MRISKEDMQKHSLEPIKNMQEVQESYFIFSFHAPPKLPSHLYNSTASQYHINLYCVDLCVTMLVYGPRALLKKE